MVGTMKKAADPKAGGNNHVLRDDESARTRYVGVDGQWLRAAVPAIDWHDSGTRTSNTHIAKKGF